MYENECLFSSEQLLLDMIDDETHHGNEKNSIFFIVIGKRHYLAYRLKHLFHVEIESIFVDENR